MKWIMVILFTAINLVVSLRYLTLVQNNGYKIPVSGTFFRYLALCTLCILPLFAINLTFFLLKQETLYYLNFCYGGVILLISVLMSLRLRIKFKFTYRGEMTFLCTNFTGFAAMVIVALYVENLYLCTFICICVLITYPLILFLKGGFLNCVFEGKNKRFIKEKSVELAARNIIKIGITGSYGKTSCKSILAKLLSRTYNVLATEKNFNTPMGIAMTVDKMTGAEDVFIAEMGARKIGDIRQLCQLVRPDFGIVTGVAEQHLKTFKSLHNIYCEKFELPKGIREDGLCIFNGNNKYTLKMFKEFRGNKVKTCVNKRGDVYAQNISLSSRGSNFELIHEEQILECQTRLIGKHNVENIVMCAALALKLNVSPADIVALIAELEPVPHRMQLVRANGINIIDDSYNANMEGVKSGMECLSLFHTRKIVYSQGIVEGGKKQWLMNRQVGILLSKAADVVILSGINARDIEIGLAEGEYQGEIHTFKTLKQAQSEFKSILRHGDTLFLQNDIPDTV